MPNYNSYFPATYQGYYQNPYFQQQVQQQQQQQVQMNGIIWVSGDAEADAYPIAPNNAVTLWNRTSPIVYFKQADASGKPSMKIYDLVEHKITPPQAEQKPDVSFATKDEVKILDDALQALRDELKLVKKEIGKKAKDDDE